MTEALAYAAVHAKRYATAYYELRQVMKYLGVESHLVDSVMVPLGLSFDFREDPLG